VTLIRNTIYSLSSTVHTSHVPVIAVVVLPPRNCDGDLFMRREHLEKRQGEKRNPGDRKAAENSTAQEV